MAFIFYFDEKMSISPKVVRGINRSVFRSRREKRLVLALQFY